VLQSPPRPARQLGIDTPTLFYLRALYAGHVLPHLRGGGRRSRSCSWAGGGPSFSLPGRAGDVGEDRLRARAPEAADGGSSCSPRRCTCRPLAGSGLRGAFRRENQRFGRAGAARAGASATRRSLGPSSSTPRRPPANVGQPVKIDNDLYFRDYSKVHRLYNASEACGKTPEHLWPSPPGRGSPARISTESDVPLTDSAFCSTAATALRLPHGALMFKSEFDLRQEATERARPDRPTPSAPTARRLHLHRPRPDEKNRQGHLPPRSGTSPAAPLASRSFVGSG